MNGISNKNSVCPGISFISEETAQITTFLNTKSKNCYMTLL